MKVIGIDLGGTKIAAAVVDQNGKILKEHRALTEYKGGWSVLKKQLIQICQELKKTHKDIAAVGIGSAGPLHAPSGTLLDPTNFGWKSPLTVPITKELKKALHMPVHLENDAAAAILAEHWMGKSGADCLVITLGTGVGMGVIADGKLVRGGRGLHPEGGHILLRSGDKSALCGCGVYGCAEAFLSGANFGKRASKALGKKNLTGRDVAELAYAKNKKALAMFSEYAELMAEYILNLVVLYYPKKIILTGSFAEASSLFLPTVEKRLKALLKRRLKTIPLLPDIYVSKLGNRAGVLGAAYIAFQQDYEPAYPQDSATHYN